MTVTERNAQLQDLRKKLAWLRTEQMAVEQRIKELNREYYEQQRLQGVSELFDDML